MITLGEVAYKAYCQMRDWKSIKGEALPQYGALPSEIREAWEGAADAVSMFISLQTGRG